MNSSNSFSPDTSIPAIPHAGASITHASSAQSSDLLTDVVGRIPQRTISDAEREAHIRDLGRLVEQAYANGDPTGARLWQAEMYEAIRSRSPTKQAQMAAEIERRISEGVDYFQSADALALGRRFG